MGVRGTSWAEEPLRAINNGLVFLENPRNNSVVSQAAATLVFLAAHQALMVYVAVREVSLALIKTIPAAMKLSVSTVPISRCRGMNQAIPVSVSFKAVQGHSRRALEAVSHVFVVPFIVTLNMDISRASLFQNCAQRYMGVEVGVPERSDSWTSKVWRRQDAVSNAPNLPWGLPSAMPQAQVVAPTTSLLDMTIGARTELQQAAYAKICDQLRLIDPISYEAFTDPVTDALGQTYDRDGLVEWFKQHDTSPLTNGELPKSDGEYDKRIVAHKLVKSTLKTIDTLVREKAGSEENSSNAVNRISQEVTQSLRLVCPKTGQPFISPVIVAESFGDFRKGVTYEKAEAEEGMRQAGKGRFVDDCMTKILRDALTVLA